MKTCATLLGEFRAARLRGGAGRKIVFGGVDGCDVYNITAPFRVEGLTVLAGRVERRESGHSRTMFFHEAGGAWRPIPDAPVFDRMEDPCVTFAGGDVVIGGTLYPVPLRTGGQGWRMEFYRGPSLAALRPFFTGPDMMKDIRMKQLPDGRIAVLTRPQGERGGRGRIGLAVAGSLDAITPELLEAAPVFDLCVPEEWVGANEAHLLDGDRLGVLGHIACFDAQRGKHYYPMVFGIDLRAGLATPPRIVAERADFPPGPAKRPELADIIFSGGLVRRGDGTATFYAGISDTEAACLTMPDPFSEFEASTWRMK